MPNDLIIIFLVEKSCKSKIMENKNKPTNSNSGGNTVLGLILLIAGIALFISNDNNDFKVFSVMFIGFGLILMGY